jgi:hypothetical protein
VKFHEGFFHHSLKKLNLPKLRSKILLIRHYYSLLRSVQIPMDSKYHLYSETKALAWLYWFPWWLDHGLDDPVSIPGRNKRFSPLPNVIRDRPSLLLNRPGDSFSGGSADRAWSWKTERSYASVPSWRTHRQLCPYL